MALRLVVGQVSVTVLWLLLVKRLDVVDSFAAEIGCGREGTGARFYVPGKDTDCWYTAQVLKVISFDETRTSERQHTVPSVRVVIPIDPTVRQFVNRGDE